MKSIDPKLTLVIAIVIGLFAVFNSFPPYDFILCIICGLVIGSSIAKINNEKTKER